ncbi:MAG: hypothetical protein BWX80_03416 [Candidatus Hydrogenedentes bacterium ADurb.Bin101]|nr:MAG: hypothetical protein BWX80_03416 [Candidatus Hydrogenedentes bacterium ADurb.Bin101]
MVGQRDQQFLAGGRLVMVADPAGNIGVAHELLDKGAAPQGMQISIAEIRLVLLIVGLGIARAAPELADVVQQRGHRYVMHLGVHRSSFSRFIFLRAILVPIQIPPKIPFPRATI